jgi:hypothetical protein
MTDKAIKALTREIKKLRKSLDRYEIEIINCKTGLNLLEILVEKSNETRP